VSANKDFIVWYTNADSLMNVDELKLLIASCSNRPDIIAVTEVKPKLKYTIQTSELNLGGYNLSIIYLMIMIAEE